MLEDPEALSRYLTLGGMMIRRTRMLRLSDNAMVKGQQMRALK